MQHFGGKVMRKIAFLAAKSLDDLNSYVSLSQTIFFFLNFPNLHVNSANFCD